MVALVNRPTFLSDFGDQEGYSSDTAHDTSNPRLRLQFSHVRPNCQVLEIQELRTDGAQLLNNDDMVTPPLLEGLLESFGDTIVELDLHSSTTYRFPRRPFRPSDGSKFADSTTHFDSDHFPKILVSHLGRFQLPNITHLVAEDEDVIELVFSLAVALKSTLTMASKIDLIGNDEEYVPLMFEILQDKLQGLHMYNPDIFADMFPYTPIEILVLSGSDTHKSDSTFVLDQFTRLRSLRKLVFYGVDSTFSAPENYLEACRDHQVPPDLAALDKRRLISAYSILAGSAQLQHGQYFELAQRENTRRYDIETQGKKPAESVGKLRSVCRRWSSLITDRHLYQTLEISCGTRAMEFINHQKASLAPPFSDVRPKCRVLKIYQFWTFGAPPDKDWDMVTPALIEGLIELFNNTIVELELEFIDTLSLPDSTIQTIGRIKNLRTLRLRNMRVKAFDSPDSEDEDDSDNDPHFFYSLLSAAQELKCLIIARFDTDHLPKISESDLARFQLPSITHLVAEEYSPANLVLSLALALKPTLTMLSIFQLIYDHADNYVALLELLQDKLQGLQIMSRRILDTISNLTFSSLRLLHIDAYKYGRPDYLKLAMFLMPRSKFLF
ncbi:hypothetical protein KEM48_004170 [Puccinia striiformis f. sp. tritici PST-130]|nr:hypothetical protein KEM48_004170 [Puccinia striiformis f. sp. tritici PST-130]